MEQRTKHIWETLFAFLLLLALILLIGYMDKHARYKKPKIKKEISCVMPGTSSGLFGCVPAFLKISI